MKKNMKLVIFVALFALLFYVTGSASARKLSEEENCLLTLVLHADENMSMAEARSKCDQEPAEVPLVTGEAIIAADSDIGVVEKRLDEDSSNILRPFSLMSHDSNYILLGAYNFQGWSADEFIKATGNESLSFKDTEVQFQLSIKTPLAVDLLDKKVDLFAAYTVRSFWQLYQDDISSPFRETNHEPEIWLQHRSDREIFGFKNSANIIGFVHQSNGQAANLSRSWNRIYGAFVMQRGNLGFVVKPWIRLQEDDENDDNPDITDYYGHGELRVAYKHKKHVFSFMSRNNLESGFSRGAVQFGWSFPLLDYKYLKGYLQYFSGYGESLIDYDNYGNRIGIGFALTDML